MKFFYKRNRGFTLLLAALVASVAVSLGSSIYSIVSKELALSSIGQDSQYAFYAADTVAECVLYWDERSDIHPNTFATSSASSGTAGTIECDGISNVPVAISQSSATAATSTVGPSVSSPLGFDLFTNDSGGYCANIVVAKSFNSQSNSIQTKITANGYSVPCAQVATAPNALQRTVELEEE